MRYSALNPRRKAAGSPGSTRCSAKTGGPRQTGGVYRLWSKQLNRLAAVSRAPPEEMRYVCSDGQARARP